MYRRILIHKYTFKITQIKHRHTHILYGVRVGKRLFGKSTDESWMKEKRNEKNTETY